VIDNSAASLQFLPDGSLAGNATCNRLVANYTQDGEGLTITLSGTTLMACPPALADQEQKLLVLLSTVSGYGIDDTGTLTLRSADGETITARRR
jgi:hypothetical protein